MTAGAQHHYPSSLVAVPASEHLGVFNTIYEEESEDAFRSSEEDCHNFLVIRNLAYSADKSVCMVEDEENVVHENALKRNVHAWYEETGVPTSVTIHLKGYTFKLHKFPLVSRSGYLKRVLSDKVEIVLPSIFPGGVQTFELVANFCYGSTILMEPANVASLICAAEVLEMTEDYGKGNLCERSDLYLKQVVLHSCEDILVVLQKCQSLLPLAEELRIVSRCIECLAFIACVEIQDPERKESGPCGNEVSGGKDTSSREWWTKRLMELPFNIFKRMIISMRRQGIDETFLCQAVIMYVKRWALSGESKTSSSAILESVISLLPLGSCQVPVSFLFILLRHAISSNTSTECKAQLQTRIASQLHLASIDDFISPQGQQNEKIWRFQVDSMQQIVSLFLSQQSIMNDDSEDSSFRVETVAKVAKLWDEYLQVIGSDSRLTPMQFSELAAIVPSSARHSHDQLYKAITNYLSAHSYVTQQERSMVCRILNCQALSQEMCIDAVQNELMPLRLIVQAMFLQQIQAGNPLPCHQSWENRSRRLDHSIEHSASFHKSDGDLCSIELKPANEDEFGLPLGCILRRESAFQQAAYLKAEFEATNTRLKKLEGELNQLKQNMHDGSFRVDWDSCAEAGCSTQSSKKVKPGKGVLGHCIGSSGFLQGMSGGFAHKLMKSLQKLGRNGVVKSKDINNGKELPSMVQEEASIHGLPTAQTNSHFVKGGIHRRYHSLF